MIFCKNAKFAETHRQNKGKGHWVIYASEDVATI